jgi:hypothetical protein
MSSVIAQEKIRGPKREHATPAFVHRFDIAEYFTLENRFWTIAGSNSKIANELLEQAREDFDHRRQLYEYLAARPFNQNSAP